VQVVQIHGIVAGSFVELVTAVEQLQRELEGKEKKGRVTIVRREGREMASTTKDEGQL